MPGDEESGNDPSQGFASLGEDELFAGHLISLVRGHFSDPEGQRFDREIVRHPGAVAVVPLHDDRSVTLVRQFRAAVGRSLLEAPAGTCDVAGEDPAATGHRELAEEAGLVAGRLEHLVTFYNSPGYTDQQTLVYLARDLSQCPTTREGVEERFMGTERVALGDVPALVAAGDLVDGQTLLGLELARRRLEEG